MHPVPPQTQDLSPTSAGVDQESDGTDHKPILFAINLHRCEYAPKSS